MEKGGGQYGNPEQPNAPPYDQPGYPQPGHSQPGYSQPGYSQPGYSQPAYSHTVVQPVTMIQQGPPDDYFCMAVVATLFCFWPTGILAISKASEARACAARGDFAGANSQARAARQMIFVSIGVGIGAYIVLGIILGVYFGLYFNFTSY